MGREKLLAISSLGGLSWDWKGLGSRGWSCVLLGLLLLGCRKKTEPKSPGDRSDKKKGTKMKFQGRRPVAWGSLREGVGVEKFFFPRNQGKQTYSPIYPGSWDIPSPPGRFKRLLPNKLVFMFGLQTKLSISFSVRNGRGGGALDIEVTRACVSSVRHLLAGWIILPKIHQKVWKNAQNPAQNRAQKWEYCSLLWFVLASHPTKKLDVEKAVAL